MIDSEDIMNPSHPLVLFDGVCNLCDSSVQFIIKRDPKKRFRFTFLQSDLGQKFLRQLKQPTEILESVILIYGGKAYFESSAALHILKIIGGLWALFYAFIVIPSFLRNFIYRIIAKNRYRWFGKKDSCMMPTPDIKERFWEELPPRGTKNS